MRTECVWARGAWASALHAQGKCTSSEKDGILVGVGGHMVFPQTPSSSLYLPLIPNLNSNYLSRAAHLPETPHSPQTTPKGRGSPADPIGNEEPQLQ